MGKIRNAYRILAAKPEREKGRRRQTNIKEIRYDTVE
jgi:hypothetical protein